MKVLFMAGGSPATVFALAPLATAMRNAGHSVVVAATEDMTEVVAGTGLAAVPATPHPIRHFITTDRAGEPMPVPQDPAGMEQYGTRWFGRFAAASVESMIELARDWHPDVVVGGDLIYAAPLVAHRLGVPYVRQTWDAVESDPWDHWVGVELRPELEALGLDALPAPALRIDICPPSLRADGTPPSSPMRFVPANRQGRLQPWMLRRGERRRVCVTSGSRVSRQQTYDRNYDALLGLVRTLREQDVELVVAAPEAVAEGVREEVGDDVLAGWVPLDVLAPTCDLIVHHCGGVTALTGLTGGAPQVLMPKSPLIVPAAERIAAQGAAVVLPVGEESPDVVAAASRDVLADDSHARAAAKIAREMERMPAPPELVGALERL